MEIMGHRVHNLGMLCYFSTSSAAGSKAFILWLFAASDLESESPPCSTDLEVGWRPGVCAGRK